MNRGEVAGAGAIASVVTFAFSLGIWYFLIIDNFIKIMVEFGYELEIVRDEIWWAMIGFGVLAALRMGSAIRSYCNRYKCKHCGKDL